MSPLVSIIIPFYNRENYIKRTLLSMENIDYPRIEIILINNCSSDESYSICRQFITNKRSHNIDWILLSANKMNNVCYARNLGAKVASGKYIYFFDSDDEISSSYLKEVSKYFDESDIIVSNCNMYFIAKKKKRIFITPPTLSNHILTGMLSTQSVIYKKEFFLKTEMWNENLPRWNDWELNCRVLLLDPKLTVIKKSYHKIYQHKDSISGKSFYEDFDNILRAIATVQILVKNKKLANIMLTAKKIMFAGDLYREQHPELANILIKKIKENKFIFRLFYLYVKYIHIGSWWFFKRILIYLCV